MKNGTWTSQFRYEDIYGATRHKCKRGFATEEEALEFEESFTRRTRGSLDMRFVDFVDVYAEDMRPYIRENTWLTKEYMINGKIIPFFGKKRLRDITTKDITDWQGEMLQARKSNGEPYSATYLRTLDSQLVAILAHAERYYGLYPNPAAKAPRIGERDAQEMAIWSKDQYVAVSDYLAEDKVMFVPIEVLYWTGMRLGELLALTPNDIDFNRSEIHVRHSFRKVKGKDAMTPPKTEKSVRKIVIPEFLRDEIRDYIENVSHTSFNERIFRDIDSHKIRTALDDGIAATGVPRIRIHDLRHSHVSLLIDMGYSAVAIAERTGHESTEITYRYAHLMPDTQDKMAAAISGYRG